MNIYKVLTAFMSASLLMIGIDKFFPFLTQCSLLADVPPTIWKAVGVAQILGSLLIWNPKIKKYIAGLLSLLMLYFIVKHLMHNTYDIGGAVFLLVICILLILEPFKKDSLS